MALPAFAELRRQAFKNPSTKIAITVAATARLAECQ
jgi:hypothetical protein